jgi:hypothetical protein
MKSAATVVVRLVFGSRYRVAFRLVKGAPTGTGGSTLGSHCRVVSERGEGRTDGGCGRFGCRCRSPSRWAAGFVLVMVCPLQQVPVARDSPRNLQ